MTAAPTATQQLSFLKQELGSLTSKISELESEREEHQLVIQTLLPLNKDRVCYRLVSGTLVKSDIDTVLPTLNANCDGVHFLVHNHRLPPLCNNWPLLIKQRKNFTLIYKSTRILYF